jgi:hypothetical protein
MEGDEKVASGDTANVRIVSMAQIESSARTLALFVASVPSQKHGGGADTVDLTKLAGSFATLQRVSARLNSAVMAHPGTHGGVAWDGVSTEELDAVSPGAEELDIKQLEGLLRRQRERADTLALDNEKLRAQLKERKVERFAPSERRSPPPVAGSDLKLRQLQERCAHAERQAESAEAELARLQKAQRHGELQNGTDWMQQHVLQLTDRAAQLEVSLLQSQTRLGEKVTDSLPSPCHPPTI